MRLGVAGLLIIAMATVASLANASPRERLASRASISAHLTETFFTPTQAGSAKVIYEPSKTSKSFSYRLSRWSWSGSRWQTIRTVTKKGVFRGRKSTAVETFFGGKPVKVGGYRLRLSFGRASKQLSFVVTAAPLHPLPVEVAGITNAEMVSAGNAYTCALISDGTIECWGVNESGELGDGSYNHGHGGDEDYSPTPVQVSGITSATAVAADEGHTCAVLSSGAVDCWGVDAVGQLGDGNSRNSATPVPVVGITDAVQVSAGGGTSCAVLSSGAVDCWGINVSGELGDGATEPYSSTPVQVVGITNAVQVSVGFMSACAVLSSGEVECWGDNTGGELGDGVKDHGHRAVDNFGDSSPTPVPVSGITSAVAVSAGFSNEPCALLSDGTVECWGGNSWTLTPLTSVTNANALSVGGDHACVRLSSGGAECWGNNDSGQLGGGTTGFSSTPIPVENLANVTSLSAGYDHSCAVESSGSVICWGKDKEGQLGSGG